MHAAGIRLKEFSDAFAFGQQMLCNGATAMDAVQEVLDFACIHTSLCLPIELIRIRDMSGRARRRVP